MPDLVVELFGPTSGPISSFLFTAKAWLRVSDVRRIESVRPTGRLRQFKIDDTLTSFHLLVRVEVAPSLGTIILQSFKIDDASLIPDGCGTNGGLLPGKRHPRVTLVSSKKGQLPLVRLNLKFIDVTAALRKSQKYNSVDAAATNFVQASAKSPTKNGQGPSPSGEPGQRDMHHGCLTSIFEFTLGHPKAWAVVVPPGLPPASTFNVLLFFPPAFNQPYGSSMSDVAPIDAVARYTRDPPTWRPFRFVDPTLDDKPVAGGDPRWGMSVSRDAKEPFFQLGNGGFEGQLAKSKKPLLYVIPLNNGEAADVGPASEASVTTLLGSLLNALLSDGLIRSSSESVAVKELGLAGYSAGGIPLERALARNGDAVSEVYLFDVTVGLSKVVLDWFVTRPRNKLRVITGIMIKAADASAARSRVAGSSSGRTADFTFAPSSPDYYDTVSNTYYYSLLSPDGLGLPGDILKLSLVGAPPSRLSEVTKLAVKEIHPGRGLTLVTTGLKKKREWFWKDATVAEASALVASWHGRRAVASNKDFDNLIGKLQGDLHAIGDYRHSWPISGGTGSGKRYPYRAPGTDPKDGDDPRKAPDFEGFLAFCLKDSAFK